MKTSVVSLPETQEEAPSSLKPAPPHATAHPALTRVAPYLVLGLFTLLLLWPLCLGRGLYWGDILLYFEPMQRYAQVSLGQGKLPLWNPYVFGGQPFVGNPQIGVFYPLNLLTPFFPSWLFLNISMLLHLFLCGAFMFRFLTRWTRSQSAALAGALVYMGSSALVGRLQFPPMIQTAAYCPLLLFCVDAWIDRPHFRIWLLTALTVGLTALAAHPQMAYLTYFCALVYGGLRLWTQTMRTQTVNVKTWREWLRFHRKVLYRGLHRAFPILVAAGMGVLLTTVQTLPALQLLLESSREQMTAEMANRFYFTLPDLLTLVAPNFFGHPITADFWSAGNSWETALFIGWAPLFFIGAALAQRLRDRLVRFWAVGILLTIWLATGTAGGLYWLAFMIVPGLSKFHDPARFLFLTTVAFAVLTAIGFDAYRERLQRKYRFGNQLALACIALPLLWYGWRWNPTTDQYRLEPGGLQADRALSSPLSAAIAPNTRIFNSSHENYWRRYITHGYADYGEQDERTIEAFLQTELPNLPMRSGIESFSGYEPVQVAGTSRLDNLNRVAQLRKDPRFSHLIGLWNVQTVVLPHEQRLRDPRLEESDRNVTPVPFDKTRSHRPTVTLWRNKDAMPRAWLVRQTRHIEGNLRILAALTSPEFDPTKQALLSGLTRKELGSLELEWGTERSRVLPTLPVTIPLRMADRIVLTADAGSAPAFLVYSGTAYPGWRAILDGHRVALHRANGSLLGLSLPPGKHQIVLSYSPESFRVGLYLFLLAVASLVSAGVVKGIAARNIPLALKGKKS